MVDILYLGGLVAVALGFVLNRMQQRNERLPSNLVHRPHFDAAGNLTCFAFGKRSPAPPMCTDRP